MVACIEKKGWKKVAIQESEKKNVKESEISALFNYIDKDKSGFISLEVNKIACFKVKLN